MAASMITRRCQKSCRPLLSLHKRYASSTSKSYLVLLPEVPPDTPETNPILRLKDLPEFSQITAEKTLSGCAKLAIDFDVEFGKHVQKLSDGSQPKTFDSVFNRIEELVLPLNFSCNVAKHLNFVKMNDRYRIAFQKILPQNRRVKSEVWRSGALYRAIKEVNADKSNLSEFQQSLVDMYLKESRLQGIDLENTKEEARFWSILEKIEHLVTHYRNRVALSTNMFSHVIDDFSKVAELPKSVAQMMAVDKTNPGRGPWKLTLNEAVSRPFLENCSDRGLRYELWHGLVNSSSIHQDSVNLSTHILINEIRLYRSDLGKVLGFNNYAELSMESKMAGSVENVLAMIESFKNKFENLADEEVARLQEFASSEGFMGSLEMWDIDYWMNRHKKHLYKIDHDEVSEFFPLDKVLSNLWELCDTLFGITIKDCTDESDPWHKDVRYFKVFESSDGGEVGSFFIDPFARPSDKMTGSWMDPGRDRSDIFGTKPLSFLNLNLRSTSGQQPCLMSFEDVENLFYEFGSGLQQILTKVPFSEISGQANIESDSIFSCANFAQFLFHKPQVMRSISCHYRTGHHLPPHVIETILASQNHMRGYKMMRQLYFSAYDMELNISDEHWSVMMENVWREFMPLPLSKEDNHPCSLTPLFTDDFAGCYYSHLWSKMIGADIMSAFEEVGFDDLQQLSTVGKRFRDTYLSLGGGVPAGEVFRRFRGRDPTQEALLKHYLPSESQS